MTSTKSRKAGGWSWMLCLSLAAAAACSESRNRHNVEWSSAPPDRTIAVAPALNFSGSADFDPVKVADIMASELSESPGIGVIGVNRVLAVLAEQSVDRIQSPEHALQVCDRLGADAILVFALIEYDAYTPVVGIAAQMYTRQATGRQLDPVAASRMARPFDYSLSDRGARPSAEIQRVFNAEHGDVQQEVKEYSDSRTANKSPYGWKKYLRSQQWYLRFCCSRVCRDLNQQMMWSGQRTPAVVDVAADTEAGR
ncbi:MAG TPA: hypothetical protein PKY77_23095 [Phycisphaerae bacterium]|nr:hypothetical protein [Phycisphaerae bacterium]HRY68484.1 hypothetical protein [Phycisphaerae bacterium]HSA29521.1 hypothetical protein [Phycisphaerae bacterium]